jgi:hypothetical protein
MIEEGWKIQAESFPRGHGSLSTEAGDGLALGGCWFIAAQRAIYALSGKK